MLDWTRLPDLVAVALLTCAFASVARRGHNPVSGLWLTGWLLIALHFAAFMFLSAPGLAGILSADLGIASLADAGILFAYASIPYRHERSSKWMLACLLVTNTLYVCVLNASPALDWALTPAALLFGIGPLLVALFARRLHGFGHILRWTVLTLNGGLSLFLLAVQRRPGVGADLAMDAVLFVVYLSCTTHFWFAYHRSSTGAFITIAGFFTWSTVFVLAPMLGAFYPGIHLESEVWNLPKYVVAVGMILLLLEDQIAHNKYLAFHDDLTGLPNRRLFQDRLTIALERARRTGLKVALLVIDLDQFKQVNDTWGHHAGDLLLQQVSMLFVGRMRTCDTVARTGGDEFSVILEGVACHETAQQVAQALVENLNEPLEIGGRTFSIGASIGVALYPDDAVEMDALCIAADMRMYGTKSIARSSNQPLPGKILPQSVAPDAVPQELRVASEGYSA